MAKNEEKATPNFWRDLFYKHNQHKLYDEMMELKKETAKTCIKCKARCCERNQHHTVHGSLADYKVGGTLDKFFSQEIYITKGNTYQDRDRSGCIYLTDEHRCAVEDFKPYVCIGYFCDDKLYKSIRDDKYKYDLMQNFKSALGVLIRMETGLFTNRSIGLEQMADTLIKKWLSEKHPELDRKVERYLNDKIRHIQLLPPPTRESKYRMVEVVQTKVVKKREYYEEFTVPFWEMFQ